MITANGMHFIRNSPVTIFKKLRNVFGLQSQKFFEMGENSEREEHTLEQVLRKHKIIGCPIGEHESALQKKQRKEEVFKQLKGSRFFRDIEECEKKGVLVGYDEVIEYKNKNSVTEREEAEEIERLLTSCLSEDLDSFYLCKSNGKLYLHVKYAAEMKKIRVGPVSASNGETEEEREFKAMWKERTEHRRFEDGKIRVCASFLEQPRHAIPYLVLSRIFRLKVSGGVAGPEGVPRTGKLLGPTFSLENQSDTYRACNRPEAGEFLRKKIDGIKETFPVKILGALHTGSIARKTRASVERRSQVYLRLAQRYEWPVDAPEMFENAVIALNGVLGKYLTGSGTKIEGISKDQTLYAEISGEKIEFIFDIEEETKLNPQKYNTMRLRVEYDRYFRDTLRENKALAETCSLVKELLLANGIYPHYVGDKTVEILCVRTAANCKTVGGGFKSAISTQYSYGYHLDTRKDKRKIRAQNNGKMTIVHDLGAVEYDLPSRETFSRMNEIFRRSTALVEGSPGIDMNYVVTPVFKRLFVAESGGASFILSRVPGREYEEISRAKRDLSGNARASDPEYCFLALKNVGCNAYFCGNHRLQVEVCPGGNVALAVGISVLHTGMRYIKIAKSERQTDA